MENIPKNIFFSRVYLQREKTQEFWVESFRPYREYFILKLKGIDSLSQAREFVGQEILLPEKDLHTLKKNNYYFLL